MTRSKKLLIAATLLAAGYTVAALLGTPQPCLEVSMLPTASKVSGNIKSAVKPSTDASNGPQLVGRVRLLPDMVPSDAEPGEGNRSAPEPAATDEAPQLVITPPLLESTPPQFVDEPAMPLLSSRMAPRARLLNESPRPLPDQAADQDDSIRPGSGEQAERVADARADSTAQAMAKDNLNLTGFATNTPVPALSANAMHHPRLVEIQPPMMIGPPTVTSPPQPTEEVAPSRAHVVVDGDTLSKLAGLYLDDPRRSDEIFAINRSVLTSPELLPIGVELRIPARSPAKHDNDAPPAVTGFNSNPAVQGSLVPVRALTPRSTMMPRAQLLRPMPVD